MQETQIDKPQEVYEEEEEEEEEGDSLFDKTSLNRG